MDTSTPVEIDPTRFRRVLGQVPTPVTVVTATTPDGPAGLVVGSFVSVSLHPPLVGIFVDRASASWPAIRRTGSFAVNVLAYDQQDMCARFARRGGGNKFVGLTWDESPQGHPLLPGVATWIDCRLRHDQQVGDHYFVVGRVLDLSDSDGASPLVFHRGVLRGL
jgi:3-hydroxy-9,10-secoandrosta-1,3,5(10)-triene-9,17-dione monooxygenase reductase component